MYTGSITSRCRTWNSDRNHIISLKAEDAARLRYDNADAWKHLIRRNINELAEIHHMKPSDIEWYAAFHEKDHHPHIHMLVFSKSGKGYLSKKGYGEDAQRAHQRYFSR